MFRFLVTFLERMLQVASTGVLYTAGSMLPFLADAVSYTVSVCSLFFIKTQFQKERVAARRKLWIEIREGLAWLWHHPLIRFIALLTGGNNLISSGYLLIIIVLAQHQHASSFIIGLIFAVGGIGGILGAIEAPFFQKRLSFGPAMISTMWLFALSMPLYAIAPNPLVLGIITAAAFLAGPLYNVVQFSYRSALIPDELQGRVNSVFRPIAFGGQPLGLALTGVLIQNVGVIQTIVLDSFGLAILALAATVNAHVRTARPLAEVESEQSSSHSTRE